MRTFHFVITLQFSEAGKGRKTARWWSSGVVDAPAGMTRSELFDQLYEDARVQGAARVLGSNVRVDAAAPIVLFFSLEPDEL